MPVQISLDGVLFGDLSFYGPDKLSSRRNMTLSEYEARRDRRYFKSLLAEGGPERLRQEMLASLTHQADRPSMDVQVVRAGARPISSRKRKCSSHSCGCPIRPSNRWTEWRASPAMRRERPGWKCRNRSDRSIRYLEVGWILQEHGGREFLAGSVPAELNLAPGQKSQILENTTLKFPQPHGAQPLAIDAMTGFVSSVEFADGSVWIPSRRGSRNAAIAARRGSFR